MRYHPSQLKIEKRLAKKTAGYFCGAVRRPAAARTRADGESSTEAAAAPVVPKPPPASEISCTSANEDDFSGDNLSVVSDLSDLSIISFTHPCLSDASGARHNSSPYNLGKSPAIAGVHGGGHTRRGGQRRRELASSGRVPGLSESDSNCGDARQRFFSSSISRRELLRLKDDNFTLRRENVNLKGQVESLQAQQRKWVMPAAAQEQQQQQQPQEQKVSSPDLLISGHLSSSTSTTPDQARIQIRQAQEEIFRLKAEDSRLRLEVKTKDDDVEALRKKLFKSEDDCSELKKLKQQLECSKSSLEDEVMRRQNVQVSLECQLGLCKTDLSRAIESRDWYLQQLQSAQEQRNAAQDEIVALQKEISTKNVAAAELLANAESSRLSLESQSQRYEIEKDEFSGKLKRIEQEMTEQETQLDQIQKEKDAMISSLTNRLTDLEGEVGEVGSLSDGYKVIQEELNKLKETVQCKEEELIRVRSSVETLESQKRAAEEQTKEAKEATVAVTKEKNAKVLGLEQDLISRNRIIEGLKESLASKEENYNMLMHEKDSLEQSMELLLEETNEMKVAVKRLSKRSEDQEKRAELLEQESLEQHQMLDDAEARVVKLKAGLVDGEAQCADLKTKLARSQEAREELCEKVDSLESEIVRLRGELEARPTPSPEPELKDEVIALRQKVLSMEQFENEVADLQQELSEVRDLKSRLADKLLESEKVYDEEVEKLRSLVIQRDALIESMKQELDRVEADLQNTKELLEESSADNERIVTEKSRRVDDLSDALVDYGATQKMLAEKQSSLAEKEEQTERLREENDELGLQVDKLQSRIEIVESENARLKMVVEEQIETDEDCRQFQAQRIARLEGFVGEYETEVKELSESNSKLQNQIMILEDANGKLQSECLLNESLKEQVLQLQKDLKHDTSLRQELGRSIELVKLNLGDEIAGLEERLRDERERHSATKEAAIRLEQEMVGLKREANGYLIRQGEAAEEIRNLEAALRKREAAAATFAMDHATQERTSTQF